jgi:hypothetical protein
VRVAVVGLGLYTEEGVEELDAAVVARRMEQNLHRDRHEQ